jgi:hypothetical protein
LKRRLFNFAAVLSLLLCMTTATLWTASFFVGSRISFENATPDPHGRTRVITWSTTSVAGVLEVARFEGRRNLRTLGPIGYTWKYETPRAAAIGRHPRGYPLGTSRVLFEFAGLQVAILTDTVHPPDFRWVRLPYWMLFVLTMSLPLWRGMLFLRERKRKTLNQCAFCGYDLRATPDRCPECGTVPDQASEPAA